MKSGQQNFITDKTIFRWSVTFGTGMWLENDYLGY